MVNIVCDAVMFIHTIITTSVLYMYKKKKIIFYNGCSVLMNCFNVIAMAYLLFMKNLILSCNVSMHMMYISKTTQICFSFF